jgi:Ca-activated chloride channel family protein
MVTALLAGLAALVVAFIAEERHARRTARVARLAFGPTGKPAAWARLAPVQRVAGLSLVAFGATALFLHDPIASEEEPNPRASRQLLVVLDVSPSMNLADAGPAGTNEMRGVRAGKVLRGILDRLDMRETRVTLVAFYTKAIPMLQDSTDKELVAGLMDGLPLYTAFKAGETDLRAGLDLAFELSKGWARGSTTLVVLTDGDLSQDVIPPARPASIADALVIGVGDPTRATVIAGHSSRQDAWRLKALATRLGGIYHDGNARHLPNAVLDRLTSVAPSITEGVGLREAGLAALGAGGAITGLLTPLLLAFGAPRGHRASLRATSDAPTATRPNTLQETAA